MDKYFVFTNNRTAYHASTLLQCHDGSLLIAAFAGSKEGQADVGIAIARLCLQSGQSTEVTFLKAAAMAHWNPVLFRLSQTKIVLYFKIGQSPRSWRTYVSESTDEGATWSQAELLLADDFGGRGPVKNKPIRLGNGDIVAGGSTEIDAWRCFVDISHDNGLTWNKYNIPSPAITVNDKQAQNALALIQPTLWESQSGHLHALMRSNNNKIYRSDSIDGGLSWSIAYPLAINNNNSGIDLLKLADGRLFLVHNHSGKNWGTRNQLHISVSEDNGNTFQAFRTLEKTALHQEYSYPAIIALHDGGYGVSYTYQRQNIAVAIGI